MTKKIYEKVMFVGRATTFLVGLAVILAASVAFAETTTPCYEAYMMSGLNPQQISFVEFRGLYSDTSWCAPGDVAR